MATWAAVQGTLEKGGLALVASFPSSLQDASQWFTTALVDYPEPAVKIMSAIIVASIIVFLMSAVTNNYSWVDKSWSILPAYYAIMIAVHSVVISGAPIHPRLAIIAGLCSFWACRLTYNFWRKGGYAWSGEDYRWKYIQDRVNPVLFQIFNLVFIAFIQNVLLASIVAPVYVAWTVSYGPRGQLLAPLNWIDAIATALAATFLILEAVADQQQWTFQTEKYKLINAKKRLTGAFASGFLDTGLFKYSRHPNFFCEQAYWWTMCLFATAATGKWYGWWLSGAIALSALFQGSTWLTEKITLEKHPKYADYQKSTSRLMPWFPGTAPTSTVSNRRRVSASPRRRVSAVAVVEPPPAAAAVEVAVEEKEAEEIVVVAVAEEAVVPRGRATTRRKSTAVAPTTTTTTAPVVKKKPAAASRSRSAPKKKSEKSEAAAPKSTGGKKKAASKPRSTSASKSTTKSTTKTATKKKTPTTAKPKSQSVSKKAAATATAPATRRSTRSQG